MLDAQPFPRPQSVAHRESLTPRALYMWRVIKNPVEFIYENLTIPILVYKNFTELPLFLFVVLLFSLVVTNCNDILGGKNLSPAKHVSN